MNTLVRLRAKRPRKAYKSDLTYLRAVYDNNKEWLNKMAQYKPTNATLRQSFVTDAMNYIKRGYTATQAANMLASSASFAGKSYRGRINIRNVILNDKKLYKKFKSLTNIKNKESFDLDKLEWNYYWQEYRYGDISIDVQHSPYGIFIYNRKEGLEEITDDKLDFL